MLCVSHVVPAQAPARISEQQMLWWRLFRLSHGPSAHNTRGVKLVYIGFDYARKEEKQNV
eukprot:m.58987 g.58987  ORF g.58987 m.58987 type:complete len:60 (-) comp15666_c0_seq2:194-373(-)